MIEIRYAPGGDENGYFAAGRTLPHMIEIRYTPGGDENIDSSESFWYFEIRNAPVGDENKYSP